MFFYCFNAAVGLVGLEMDGLIENFGSMTMGSIGEKIGGRCGESWWDESMVPD